MIAYRVNNKIINNIYLAQYESYRSGQPITFHCFDDEYDRLDWTQEPEFTFDQLMDIHALNLRDKYERLIFNWSGGTDSHTIYNVFKRNNIHIDEIVIKYTRPETKTTWFPIEHYDWMKQNHYDTTTEITLVDGFDLSISGNVFNHSEWLLDNKGTYASFIMSHVESNYHRVADKHSGHNWGVIFGFEKPQVYFDDGRWYTRQADNLLRTAIGYPNVECFYLDPILHLKQSHLAKRALKALRSKGVKPGNPAWAQIGHGAQGYKIWAKAVGRHDELTSGISNTQKIATAARSSHVIDVQSKFEESGAAKGDFFLSEKIKDQDPVALNYVKGIYNIMSDQGFRLFLEEHCFVEPGSFFKTKPIWSKSYDIGT